MLRVVGYPKRHLPNVTDVCRQRRGALRGTLDSSMSGPSAGVPYDEFAYFADNATEFGIAYDHPPLVRRAFVDVGPSRRISALVWGEAPPELVLIHGGAQNAHTWDTVALALRRPLVAVDLPGHGHSGPASPGTGSARAESLATDVGVAIDALAPDAAAVVGMSLGGLTAIALAASRPELVRRLVLVDITPGVDRAKAKAITDFVRGPGDVRQLRRHPGEDDRAQPDAHGDRRYVGASCTTPNSSTMDRGAGATAASTTPRRRTGSPAMTRSTRRRDCGMPSVGSTSR